MKPKLLSFDSLEQLSVEAAERTIALANEAITRRGKFTIALAGGSTPKGLYGALSSAEFKTKTDWSKWQVYFSDERLVLLSDERSNYKMAHNSLLKQVSIDKANIFAVPVELGGEAVAEYERTIRANFAMLKSTPVFDLILLGLGSDGHTASLFPGKPALKETNHLVVESEPGVLPPPVNRVTFTFPLINNARNVMFLAGGQDKKRAFEAAYHRSSSDEKSVPAGYVMPQGRLWWLVTKDILE